MGHSFCPFTMMKLYLLPLLTGLIVGFLFALMKLPIPAPPALPGILGIVGIYLGFKLFHWMSQLWVG
ncbi:XapX domain-containing protein [Desmospora activa DSM 45169]|uniref:XapX domain-containing protein n=2 Tax=Desmospora TaxID=500614 RepID=A0A2T4Z4R2_9BACL|nr:XapX domain-containing protein [Desmospora activa DSM 45169]